MKSIPSDFFLFCGHHRHRSVTSILPPLPALNHTTDTGEGDFFQGTVFPGGLEPVGG